MVCPGNLRTNQAAPLVVVTAAHSDLPDKKRLRGHGNDLAGAVCSLQYEFCRAGIRMDLPYGIV